jgi:poly-gamma-glutamate synthesis protein (capsule biosynthesis protein)
MKTGVVTHFMHWTISLGKISMKLSFIGDVMLARHIGSKYRKKPYQIVSDIVLEKFKDSEFVIANLESPVAEIAKTDGHHLSFQAHPNILKEVEFVDIFSLSNNHINDCGTTGMDETVTFLDSYQFSWNGLYEDEYSPHVIQKETQKCALFTCTDSVNHSFENGCHWNILKVDDLYLDEVIKKYKDDGYFIILYAHVGMLFTKFPNPSIREILHRKIDIGVDTIVTVHPHVLGGMEYYNEKPIFYSIGDFVMDGNSYRRRRTAILDIEIKDSIIKSWEITPVIINKNFETVLPSNRIKKIIIKSWGHVTSVLSKIENNYQQEFKKLYKIEIIQHNLSTLKFLIDTKGLLSTLKLLHLRAKDVNNMIKWMHSDRSSMRRD